MYEKENNRTELKHKTVTLAMNAFATKGIKGVTMDDIAMGLGISKRTLYEMFEDKEELLIACMLEHQREKNVFVNEVHCCPEKFYHSLSCVGPSPSGTLAVRSV